MVIGTGDSSRTYFVDVTNGSEVSSPIPATVTTTERSDAAGVCRVYTTTASHAAPIRLCCIDVVHSVHADPRRAPCGKRPATLANYCL